MYLFVKPIACWYIDVLVTTVYSIMTDLYYDINPVSLIFMKRYKHRGLSKTKIYQQVYVFIRKSDTLVGISMY